MTARRNRDAGGSDAPPAANYCPSCGAAAQPEARFCSACGVSLADGADRESRPIFRLAGAAAVGAVLAAVVVALVVNTGADRDAPPPAPAAALFPAPPRMEPAGTPPDLSQMTPREAADRLFNRIMTASESGDRAEALRFVPMAVQAYGSLPALDRDALYHLGLIHLVAGEYEKVGQQIAGLREGAPNHLLALALEQHAATQSGDSAAAARVLAAFAAAYGAEIATGRPEYEAHRNTIDRLYAAATAAAPALPRTAEDAAEGARLFEKNCAACHGQGAAGSDRGPPLVHKVYEPGHHDDGSFHRAVRQGVRPHHWSFGAMPPIPGVSDREVDRIIAYVRGLQRKVGIR